ncbi:MAG TPA: HAMP domain-containing sensor histidine kinase, partial [Terracidiphilus sp.]
AVLQYRWTNEASSADEMRIGAELESLMMKWHSDVYGEFAAICTAIQVGPDSGARDTWEDYFARYLEWNYALPHESLPYIYRNPDLVGEVYIWETHQQAKPRLFWLNLDSKKIQLIAPPPGFSTLLNRLQTNSASLSMALSAWKLPGQSKDVRPGADSAAAPVAAGSNTIPGWQFDENVPAIVHPIFHRGAEKSLNSDSPVDWIIVTLDMNVFRKRVLPELSARYFGGLEGLEYKLALVRTGSHPETIYASDPDFGLQQAGSADSTMNLFGFAPQKSNSASSPTRNSPSLRRAEWHSLTAPYWFPVIEYGATPNSWLLQLQHRAGPLQLTLARIRRNNLALSFVILLLLALSIAVLTVAGYRAQHFAKLQMDFVASVSHELRTPLTAIFSAGENIKDGVIQNERDLAEYGSIVTGQSRQLMNHVDRILMFASIRSGNDRYSLRPLEVSDILDAVRRNISALLAEEKCTLEESIEPGLPAVMGDMFAVCGCLENLITNAIKYGGSDRRIYLLANSQTLAAGRQEVAISVQDHGLGIPGSELKHIFEPFYRTPEAAAAQIHGTGLGLSLAKHLAEAMGGRLTVTSQLESGSIFTLHLQLSPDQNHRVPTESNEALIR